jgi:hypothetical protein
LFKDLATLRTDARLFANVDELEWRGPGEALAARATRMGSERLLTRASNAAKRTAMSPQSQPALRQKRRPPSAVDRNRS